MPDAVRARIRVICNEIFCQKLPLPNEATIISDGNVCLEWCGSCAPAEALVQAYPHTYAVKLQEDELPKFKQEASEICGLLAEHFAEKFDSSLYDSRDDEITRIKGKQS